MTGWHLQTLLNMGLRLERFVPIPTPRLRMGANHEARVESEVVMALVKP